MNNNFKATKIIKYSQKIEKEESLLPILDGILNNLRFDLIDGWDWTIVEVIGKETDYISIDTHEYVDSERTEDGFMINDSFSSPIGVTINDEKNLIDLREEVDNSINKTNNRIDKFLNKKNKQEWNCLKCNRFLGKKLSSSKEIKKLLNNFVVKKYWSCRSCKSFNYFTFNKNRIQFKIKEVDKY